MTDAQIKEYRDAGYGVAAWTVNNENDIVTFLLKGITNLTTNNPIALIYREQLRNYGTLKNTFKANLPEIAVCELLKTDTPPTNDAPIINEEITEDTQNAPEQTGTEAQTEAEKSGCGSVVGGSALALMAASACAAALPRKKKRD